MKQTENPTRKESTSWWRTLTNTRVRWSGDKNLLKVE